MAKPKFITFTGVDDLTSIEKMVALAADYPVEFGVLFSPKQQGIGGRYPAMGTISRLLACSGRLRLAAHVCGEHSERLVAGMPTAPEIMRLLPGFQRVQVNTTQTVQVSRMVAWGARLRVDVILQYRQQPTPTDRGVSWLFDASGGRGVVPKEWPLPELPDLETLRGYAGGLSPMNVAEHVATIGHQDPTYWIDMETGVRDADDRFSIELCRRVCEAVYGSPA